MSYGWSIGSPGQGDFPTAGPAPRFDQQQFAPIGQAYCSTVTQPTSSFMGQPPTMGTLGIGWQQGGPANPPPPSGMAFGGFNPAPMQSAPNTFGFGFAPAGAPPSSQYHNGPSAPEPSAPPPAQTQPSAPVPRPIEGGFSSPRTDPDRRPQTDSTPIVVATSKPEKPDRPPAPKVVLVSDPASSKSTLDTSISDDNDRRNTSQYKEALQNMAALMTDVDLTDDVMNDLKKRFDLK